MAWTKLEPMKGRIVGCANCGYKAAYAEMEMRIAVGFGAAYLKKDDEIIFSEDNKEFEDCMTIADAEILAAADPDHDWRIVLYGPMSEVEYQRHDVGKWALVRTGLGFA